MSAPEPHILIVDDNREIRDGLSRYLRGNGYRVSAADSAAAARRILKTNGIDLAVVDVMMPGEDGLAFTRAVRADSVLPVIMLTARSDVKSKVDALHAGADDYITKPFAFEELLARIQAVTRRFDQPEASQIRAGSLRLDLLAQRVWRDDELIELTAREFALLEYFMRHPNQVLSRQQILFGVWDYDFDPESNIVDVYVRYLRGKIDEAGKPSAITTVRGAGYRFELPPGAA